MSFYIHRWPFAVRCQRHHTSTRHALLYLIVVLSTFGECVSTHFIHRNGFGLSLSGVCFRVKRRLLGCPLRLGFDVNSWMHYFNWTPTMEDSHLLQPTTGAVHRLAENDKEIIFFVTVQVFLRYVKIHRWTRGARTLLMHLVCFFFFCHSLLTLFLECIVKSTKTPNSPIVFLDSLLNTNQIDFFFLGLFTRRFQSISFIALLSIDLFRFVFFSPFLVVKFQYDACVSFVTRSFDRWRNFVSARLDSSECCVDDSVAATLCKHIKWTIFFCFFANKDEKYQLRRMYFAGCRAK